MPSHNMRLCADCFEFYFKRQVEKALKKFSMINLESRIGLGISGGKDSLALWQALTEMGIETKAFHINLGLEDFSIASENACQKMAEKLGRSVNVVKVKDYVGLNIIDIVRGSKRQFCSVCGTIKRHIMNRYVQDNNLNVVCSGHNLDDEASRLLGNLIYQRNDYIKRTWPVLPETEGILPKKIKPLIRLDNYEIRIYAKIKKLPYLKEKCPRSKGATLHYYGAALDQLEENMPGIKRNLYFGHLKTNGGPNEETPQNRCQVCGLPTRMEICSACGLIAKAKERLNEK